MKRILTTLSQKWPEYLLEVLVLIVGIYGAFALEEWNENNKNSRYKELMVQNIEKEFEVNSNQLNNVLNYDRQAIAACESLLGLINTSVIPKEFVLDSLVNNMYALWTFDPTAGAVRSAISSGQIHLLSQETLKEYLFSWQDLALDAKEEEQRFVENAMKRMPEFEDRARAANNFHQYDSRVPRSQFPSDYESLLHDPEFENFLASQMILLLDAERELETMAERIDDILNQLQQEK